MGTWLLKKRVIVLGSILIFVVLALLTAGTIKSSPSTLCDGKCNIIFIVVDTLGAQHLQSYGYDRDTAPRIENFFAPGTRFANAYSVAPWTEPSFASFLFSDLPSDITYKDLDIGTRPSLVSELRDNGYAIRGVLLPPTVFIYEAIGKLFVDDEKLIVPSTLDPKNPLRESAAATRSLSVLERSGKPFFLMIHSPGPHVPYDPLPEDEHTFGTEQDPTPTTAADLTDRNRLQDASPQITSEYRLKYDQKILGIDSDIGSFLDSIPAETLKHTVVILTADHGEAFDEHGKFGHHQSLYAEETHVPLFIRTPRSLGSVVSTPVSLVDIAPTILSLAGITIPKQFIGVDQSSLKNSWLPRILHFEDGNPFFFSLSTMPPGPNVLTLSKFGALHTNKPIIDRVEAGIQFGWWKYFTDKGTVHIFNTAIDPHESRDLLKDSSSLTRMQHIRLSLFELYLKLRGYSLVDPGPGAIPSYNIQG